MSVADRDVGEPVLGSALAIRLTAAAAVGVSTGLVVLALEHAVDRVVHELLEAPAVVPALSLVGGSVLTAILIRFIGGRSSASTEVFVEEFHRTSPDVRARHAPGRVLGAFTTLGSGAPLGLEGPAVYTGSVMASLAHRHWKPLRGQGYHALLVAGSAAGIAAAFKAPAAGAIFAMEVPFRGRLAGERVLPALFGSAGGYLTMAAVDGVESEIELPLIDLTFERVLWCLALGLAVGVVARGVIGLTTLAERTTALRPVALRAVVAGLLLAGIYGLGRSIADEPVAITSGNHVIDWAILPDHGILLLVGVLALRAVGPAVSIAGGGVGGLFIPLMAAGSIVGRLFADAVDAGSLVLYVTVGAATMLGAGYAVPLTGVVFVAEYTGQAAVIVPALVAMTVTRLVVGHRSVSPSQRP